MTGCTATGNGGHGITARTSSATITGCYSWGNLWNSLIEVAALPPSRARVPCGWVRTCR